MAAVVTDSQLPILPKHMLQFVIPIRQIGPDLNKAKRAKNDVNKNPLPQFMSHMYNVCMCVFDIDLFVPLSKLYLYWALSVEHCPDGDGGAKIRSLWGSKSINWIDATGIQFEQCRIGDRRENRRDVTADGFA